MIRFNGWKVSSAQEDGLEGKARSGEEVGHGPARAAGGGRK